MVIWKLTVAVHWCFNLVDHIKPLAKLTNRLAILDGLGGFTGLFDLKAVAFKDSIFVSGTDGVGTKLKVSLYKKYRFDTKFDDTVIVDS